MRTGTLLAVVLSLVLALLSVRPVFSVDPDFSVRRNFGPSSDWTESVAAGDMDGDGDLDIITGNVQEQNVVYLNDGVGNFPAAHNFGTGSDRTESVAAGDMDGDGDLDIITGNVQEQNVVYLNDGASNFPAAHNFGTGEDETESVAVGDMDGDGDLDIITGNVQEQNVVYLNDGVGNFPAAHNFGTGEDRTNSVAVGDMDGDGDLDIITGNWEEQNVVYLNDGASNFPAAHNFGTGEDETESVAVGDMDGDGDLDIIAGNWSWGEQNVVYLNDGAGNFPAAHNFDTGEDLTESVAVGDMDGDGDLDIITGDFGQRNVVYLNDGAGNFPAAHNFGSGSDRTYSVAAGDMDGDGDLDIITGNGGQQNVVYLNDGVGNFPAAHNFGTGEDWTNSVAVGDMDGDGDLDIITGNGEEQNVVYLNDGVGNFPAAHNFGTGEDETESVAAGDMDGDGDLDIITGNVQEQNVVYLNDGVGNFPAAHNFGTGEDATQSVAVGDMDGDGDLDIITGNGEEQNVVYLNDGVGNFPAAHNFGTGEDATQSVAVGDMDGDGDLDIITGNGGQQNVVYLNDGVGNFPAAHNFGTGEDETESVAAGDMDGDGDLDIIAGNGGQQNVVYLNDGASNFPAAHNFGTGEDETESVAVGDMDGDGDLDIITGNFGQQNVVYLNDGVGNFPAARNFGTGSDLTQSMAAGDMDGDGDLDIIAGNGGQPNVVYLNDNVSNSLARVQLVRPIVTKNANFYSTPVYVSDKLIALHYRLIGAENHLVGSIAMEYSLDGGGRWRPCVPEPGTSTTHLATSAAGSEYVFTWNTLASGFFGQSDNVVLRLRVYGQPSQPAALGTYRYVNSTAGPFQHAYFATHTFPFRVRGTQVQAVDTASQPLSQALVYRLLADKSDNAQLYTDHAGRPYHTNSQGYLQGRGELLLGDQLAALWPVATANLITFTRNITLYETSAKPNVETLAMKPVDKPGVQVLTVSADNKLLLFNLDVALEWDARKDAQFMEQLRFNLQRTSQLLFDWSNGQAALGQVRIFHDAKRNTSVAGFHPWADSHIRIYATNRMRPSAAEGGIISPTLELSELAQGKLITYGPGQVHIGALWNRYGESSGALGEDWPRALAHELGHYLFFLEDDYLGFDAQGRLVTVPAEGDAAHSCPGVMNDPYRESQSEFQPEPGWTASGCIQTLAQQTTGRADWQTISHFYKNTFITPTVPFGQQNPGPSILPLAVTQLQVISPTIPTQTVAVPIFYLTKAGGGTYVPGPNAQAYLFQGDWLTDLGQPTLDQVQAWGARPHDRLCVYEATAGYQGCVRIQPPVDQVALQQVTPWQPTIVVSPVSSRTIALQVTTALNAGQLAARLYPTDAPAPTCILLQPTEPNQYAGTFPTLAEPALDGYVHLWVQTANTPCAEPQATAGQETVTGYAIGGNPVHRRSRRTLSRGSGVHRRSRRAPAISADGQVMVFGDALDLNQEQEWFFTLQATSDAPAIPPGRTLVGQAYRLTASPNAPKLTDASISFGYLGDQVPAGEERFLHIYFWDTPSATWQPLATFVDAEYNVTSAKTQGPGLYALLASLEVPLTNVGWNNFAYPVPGTQPVAEALAAIDGAYTVVYGYQPTNATDSWLVYSPSAPDWVNDLKGLAFGQGYWLYATQAITLYLQGDDSTRVTAAAGETSPATSYGSTRVTAATGLTPPATFYGAVQTASDFTPQVGMEVTAWIDQQVCGRSQVQKQGDALVYVIKVVAEDGSAHAGCGADGRTVSFQVNGVTMLTQGVWDNTQVWDVSLTTQLTNQVFLPLCSTNARQALHEAGNSSENHLLLPWIKQ